MEKCWNLVELLDDKSKFIAFDCEGVRCPGIDGIPIWDAIPEAPLPEEWETRYREAFASLEWEKGFHVTQKGYWSGDPHKSRGATWVPEKGYDVVIPVFKNWDLPVTPSSAKTQARVLAALLAKARKYHCADLDLSIREQCWEEWYAKASEEAIPQELSLEERYDQILRSHKEGLEYDLEETLLQIIKDFGADNIVRVHIEGVRKSGSRFWGDIEWWLIDENQVFGGSPLGASPEVIKEYLDCIQTI